MYYGWRGLGPEGPLLGLCTEQAINLPPPQQFQPAQRYWVGWDMPIAGLEAGIPRCATGAPCVRDTPASLCVWRPRTPAGRQEGAAPSRLMPLRETPNSREKQRPFGQPGCLSGGGCSQQPTAHLPPFMALAPSLPPHRQPQDTEAH